MTCLYTPYVSPIEKKLRDRLKAARARMEGQACRRELIRPKAAALPVPTVELPAPVAAESWVARQKRLWFWIEKDSSLTIRDVQEATCDYFDIRRDLLLSNRRNISFVVPRHIAMYLSRELTAKSFPEIGRAFKRDHTVPIYAANKIEKLIRSDICIAHDTAHIENILRGRT
jgi:hypothetical protein